MKLNEAIKLPVEVKGFELEVTVLKVYPVQERKGYYFQDLIIGDDTAQEKLSIRYGNELPADGLDCVCTSHINKTIKCLKCGINEYKGKKNIKTAHFSVLSDSVPETQKPPQALSEALKQPIPAQKQPLEIKQTDWEGKERRDIRKTLFDTALMSLTRNWDTKIPLNTVDLLKLVNEVAESGFEFVYKDLKDEATKIDSGEDVPF